jgi:hypothetical protein
MAWPAHMQRPANGAGKGDGWGGPAKGESAARIKPGDPDGIQQMSNDPEVKARQAERAAKLHDHLYALATDADRQETQLAATIAYLDRVEGKPVSRVDNRVSGGEGGPVNFTWLPPTE